MYKTLFFDLDDTLFDYKSASRLALKNAVPFLVDEFGFNSVHSVYQQINLELWKKMEDGVLDIETLRRLRFERLLTAFSVSDADASTLEEYYLSLLSEQAILLPHAERVIKELAGIYRLGIITNGIPEVQRNRLKISGLEQYFNPFIIALEHNVWKPDPLIFSIAIEKAGMTRDEVLYIGDSLSSDLVGASNSGIDFCWYNPHSIKSTGHHDWKHEIKELRELIRILG